MIDQHPEVLSEKVKIAILSSFTIEPLVDFLTVEAAGNGINLQPYIAPYGQVGQEILNSASDLYQFAPEMTVLMVEPQSLAENPIAAATELIALVGTWKQNTDTALVLGTFIAQADWPLHILPSEHRQQMIEANDRLKQAFKGDSQVQLCDLDALAAYYGYANALSPEMAAMARIPFAEDFIALLAQKLVSHLKVHCQIIRKCLVLDCDNTLWGGIIGEDGIDGIKLGPDWPGREFVEFQKAILELYEQGVILAINSKNNEADVMAVLREHPHMLLREHHFASISVNWDPKPENMERIADEINIGTDTLVFVDDNPAERTMMQQMLPEVEVLQLPANPALYAKTLRQTNYFAKASLTAEDKKRGQIYAAQRQRHSLQKTTASLEDYLKSLEMICSIRLAEQKDIKRAAQLTQRTNQFNLTTRRYSESDIQQMLENPNWNVYVLGLKDKFGDNGTVGLALVNKQTEAWNGSDTTADLATVWRIDTFLMSCRVIGRQAEDALVDRICRDAVGEGAVKLKAEYRKTAKNDLVAGFWQKMNFQPSRDPDCIGRAGTSQASVYAFELTNYQPKTFEYLTLEEKAEKE
ncbi:MAG: HAD-IIIC family phosphatase [Planctomycetota bacterium]|jgi:FkbH-like protein